MRMSDWSSDVCSSDLFCARSREQTMRDYIPGFGNHISTEAVAGALPVGQNSPQRPAFGLYTEQLSGTEIGRASCRERGCQDVEITWDAATLKKKEQKHKT